MSSSKDILDRSNHPVWGGHLMIGEELLWQGTPATGFTLWFLEEEFYHDVITGPISKLSMYLGVCFYLGFLKSWWLTLLGVVLLFVHGLYWNYISRNTKYALTDSKLLFLFDYGVFKSIKVLPLNQIISVHPVLNQNGTTTYYFPNHHSERFRTRDFVLLRRRDHPTFEYLKSGASLVEQLNPLIANNNLPALSYHYPIVNDRALRWLRWTLHSLLILSIIPAVLLYHTYALSSYSNVRLSCLIGFVVMVFINLSLLKGPAVKKETFTQVLISLGFFLFLLLLVF